MMKNLKRLLSMMLALSMVFSLVVPAAATETHEHDHAEEAKQEETINMEAVLENITVNAEDVDFELDLSNKIVLADPDTEVDMEDPAIIAFETDLKAIKVWDEAAQQPVPLTEEQIQQVLGLYQQYLNHWAENADTLGMQVPFFLNYNDDGEDGLGILGEMIAMDSRLNLDMVRAGYMSVDDLTGMILNFLYGDQLGVAYYGKAIEAARDEVMQLIKNSGAQTEAQKLLIINDWLAHNNTFDMPYIMNADKDTNGDGVTDEKDDNKDAMVAPNPVKHEHYEDVLAVMTDVYEGILTDTFETQIRDGLEAEFKRQYYTEAIKNIIYQGGLAEARQNEELIAALKAQLKWDEAYAAAEKEVYDEAYEEFMLNNHEHDMDVKFTWKDTKDADGNITAWTCEKAEATCKFEGCTVEFAVAVDTEEVTEEATCTENGTITYTATATVTIPGIEGEDGKVGEFEETKEATIIAAGHVDKDNDYVCDACEEVLKAPHVHDATVTLTWNATGDAVSEAKVTCGEDCEDELTATVTGITSKVTKQATCKEAGEKVYTAAVTVKDSEGNAVEKVTVKNETNTVVVTALAHVYEMGNPGVCDACGTPHEPHVADPLDPDYCRVCYARITEEHTHTEVVDNAVAATCTKTGLTEGTHCSECNEVIVKQEVVPMIPHTEVVDNAVAATCTTAGKTEGKHCSVCNTVLVAQEDIERLPHTEVVDNAVAATCTTAGKTEGKHCSVCNTVLTAQEDIAALGHNYEGGKCTRCEAAEPHEHTFSEYGDGTCTVDGCDERHVGCTDLYGDGWCDVCGGDMPRSSSSSIPEFFTSFTKDAATVAEEGEGEGEGVTPPADEDEEEKSVEELADEYAKGIVEEKKAEIEAAVNESTGLNAAIEQAVTGGTEDIDTDIEKEIWAEAEGFVAQEEVAAALAEDPVAFIDSQEMFQQMIPVTDEKGDYIIGEDGNPVMMTLAQQLHLGWDAFWADAQEKGLEVDPVNAPGYKMTVDQIVADQMDTPMADLPPVTDANGNPQVDEEGNVVHMTPNQAVPVFAAQAAEGLTGGIINYWEGSHFGALGFGTSVCLGYTKAFTYLVQCLHPEIYGKNGANTDMSNAANWKTREEVYVYGADGKIDINQNYVVDAVRVTFDASVTMYGETEDNFNSDHFWNAVKIDGQWYYADPCYVDVFTEVMMRDRVETDGQMNHLYFIFSHTAAVNMYDGNYKEIKTMYDTVATDETYEDSWISRIKSNTYFNGGYAYYMYDSTDMLTMMEEFENQNQNAEIKDSVYKIVRHALDTTDSGDGDKDYDALIIFNDEVAGEDDKTVAKVKDPSSGSMVESELLTELYAKHTAFAETYPSIAINAAYHSGKIYFNIANVIMSYDVSSGALSMVKEYNVVHGQRDTTKPFGGMAFSVVSEGGDFTVENHPIAGMTIKGDGNMYVSVATNFAFISGKADRCDPASDGYGYEYEESNYNSEYNSYMDFGDYSDEELESYGYVREINDNDEFMWTANFVETLSMNHLGGGSHSYEAVTVGAVCGVDAYTENRCTSCGYIQPDSRVYEEGTAMVHHFVEWDETFYTKDDAGNWNTGHTCVCTECGYSVSDPGKAPGQDAAQELKDAYEEDKAAYDAAMEIVGHTYEPTDAVWAEDNSSVTFTTLECSAICPERKPFLDCLRDDDTITITLAEAVTVEVTEIETTGICAEGVTKTYKVIAEVEVDGEKIPFTATKVVELEPTNCIYEDGVCIVCGNCAVKRIYGEDRIGTALAVATALKDTLNVKKFDAIILAAGGSGSDQTKFADALSGSYLATEKGAPILLYTKGNLSPKNLAFIEENLSGNGIIYLLGGNVSIPEEVEEALVAEGYTTKRLGGANRYDTNLVILEEAGIDEAKEILISSGRAFADSLSASATGLPIMLVNGTNTALTDAQVQFLKSVKDKKITILGGTAAVSEALEAAIEEAVGTDVERIFGAARESTSAMIAEKYFADADTALIAYSRMYPDGLAGGVLANALKAPLLLTNAGSESIANEYIEESEIEVGYVLGGTAALTDETAKAVFGLSEAAVINVAYYTEK